MYMLEEGPGLRRALLLLALAMAVVWYIFSFRGSQAQPFVSPWRGEHVGPSGRGSPLVGSMVAQPAAGPDSVVGPPSIGPERIDEILRSYNSPAAGSGRVMYELGVKYGIDPAFCLAFFIHESTAGTRGVAAITKSIGNIRTTPGYRDYQGYRHYDSWEQGIEDWYQLIRGLYVDEWSLVTLEQILPVYAPPADNNNTELYIQTVRRLIESWRQGGAG